MRSLRLMALVILTACGVTSPVASVGEGTAGEAPAAALARAGHSLEYLERVTGGADAGAELPLVIAVHGRGDRPEHFAGLLEGWDVPARIVLPRAPKPTPGGGGSWFVARVSGSPEALTAEVAEAADALAALIRQVAAERPTAGRPVVTGFSQGGMLSYAMAVRHPELIAGTVPVSGFLPEGLLPADPSGAAPVRALHGGADPRIDVSLARASVAALRAAGADATLREYPGVPHAISREMRAELERALSTFFP